ncbi:MAG: cytochrome P450 [Actinomycetota bacterium]
MVTNAFDLDVPTIEPSVEMDRSARTERYRGLVADGHWLVRTLIGFAVISYDDVTGILRDKRWHNAIAKLPEMMGITDPEILENRRRSIITSEGDEHTRLRRLVAQSFSPRAADRLRPAMRRVVNDLIDPVAEAGRADLVADISEPYPIPIICELLGAPDEDWRDFSRWAEAVLAIFNGTVNDELERIKQAQRELDEYTMRLIERRRDDPHDDLLSSLIAAEEEGDRLSSAELVSLVNAVIVAGTDTTRNQLSCAVAVFADHPDQWALLAEQPELAPRAVEEVMRYMGAVRGVGRFASEDIEYRGVLFPKDTFVFPSLAAANVDDGVVDGDPFVFDIRREPVRGHMQMTFGSGIHYCLGASLARAELQEALAVLAQRLPDLRVDGDVVWKPPTTAIFGADRLPITFTPGH